LPRKRAAEPVRTGRRAGNSLKNPRVFRSADQDRRAERIQTRHIALPACGFSANSSRVNNLLRLAPFLYQASMRGVTSKNCRAGKSMNIVAPGSVLKPLQKNELTTKMNSQRIGPPCRSSVKVPPVVGFFTLSLETGYPL